MYLNNVWRPNLSVTGISGIPNVESAGNVVRASTSMRLSMRIGPDMDSQKAVDMLVKILTTDVPYKAQVDILQAKASNGWQMQQLSPNLVQSLKDVGTMFFDGMSCNNYGMGGTIPFLCELG